MRIARERPRTPLRAASGGRSGFRLMGIVNVTPDSFSDGGRFLQAGAAIEHGLRLIGEGAQIVDVGGESTRPGAEPVAAEQELRRVLPVIEGLAAALAGAQISIDTPRRRSRARRWMPERRWSTT